jgi:hypothetical protein
VVAANETRLLRDPLAEAPDFLGSDAARSLLVYSESANYRRSSRSWAQQGQRNSSSEQAYSPKCTNLWGERIWCRLSNSLVHKRLLVQGHCTSWKRTPSRRAMGGSVGPERLSFEEQKVARYPTCEQAERRARELNAWAERATRQRREPGYRRIGVVGRAKEARWRQNICSSPGQ